MSIMDKSYQPVQSLTVKAVEDIPAFRFVSHLGSLCDDNSRALGVSETSWINGENIAVVTLGTMAIETSTTVNAGDDLAAAADGKARPALTTEIVNARALEDCTGAGYVKVKLVP